MEKYVNENNEVVTTTNDGTWVVFCDLCGKEIFRHSTNV